MDNPLKIAVTGAGGYSGRYIATEFYSHGYEVINLSGHPERAKSVEIPIDSFPFDFHNPQNMATNIQSADVFVNTYWIRFASRSINFDQAVQNSYALIEAAKLAEVRKFIHISITNPDINSSLPYFRGKALIENYLHNSGLNYTILRPTVIFGNEDILINNITYLLRRFPIFPIAGDGTYRLQPIFVKDLASLCFQEVNSPAGTIIDAIGPDTYSFKYLVHSISKILDRRVLFVHIPPYFVYLIARIFSVILQDVLLTRDELKGLMADLLWTSSPPMGKTSLLQWLDENKNTIGIRYASELKRHYLQASKK